MSELVIKNEIFQEMSNGETMELNGGWSELAKKFVEKQIIDTTLKLLDRAVTATSNHYQKVGEDIKNGKMQPCPYQC